MTFQLGPQSRDQFRRLSQTWRQGEHVVLSGGTGSGKTLLGRYLDQIRINAGGSVIVFVCKLKPDETLTQEYKGFKRWESFKTKVSPDDKRILLWPDTGKGKTVKEKREIQKEVFRDAVDKLSDIGKWTVDFDEGLYMCDPKFMDMSDEVAMLHALGRSSKLTIITKTQRPAHIPLIIYGSAAHAFVGRTRLASDNKRLAELDGRMTPREMQSRIAAQGRHDFLWLPVAPDWDPETVNLEK